MCFQFSWWMCCRWRMCQGQCMSPGKLQSRALLASNNGLLRGGNFHFHWMKGTYHANSPFRFLGKAWFYHGSQRFSLWFPMVPYRFTIFQYVSGFFSPIHDWEWQRPEGCYKDRDDDDGTTDYTATLTWHSVRNVMWTKRHADTHTELYISIDIILPTHYTCEVCVYIYIIYIYTYTHTYYTYIYNMWYIYIYYICIIWDSQKGPLVSPECRRGTTT